MREVHGVYSSRAKAQKAATVVGKDADIDDWDLNEMPDKSPTSYMRKSARKMLRAVRAISRNGGRVSALILKDKMPENLGVNWTTV